MPDPVDPIAAADPWSRSTALLSMSFDGTSIATGTGILAQPHPGGKTFLVTALHNLTGRDPITNRIKSDTGALPNCVRAEAYFTDLQLKLYDVDNNPNSDLPLFKTH